MNILNINQPQNSVNFGALQSIKFSKKLQNNPKLQNQLLDTFEKSEVMKEYCKKFNVDIVFNTLSLPKNKLKAFIGVVAKERPASKLEQFDSLFDLGFSHIVEPKEPSSSLEEATATLCKYIEGSEDKFFNRMIEKIEKNPERLKAQDAFEKVQFKEKLEKGELKNSREAVTKKIGKIYEKFNKIDL